MDYNSLFHFFHELTSVEQEFRRAFQEARTLSPEECTRLINRINRTEPDPLAEFFSCEDYFRAPKDPKVIAASQILDKTLFPNGEKICINRFNRYSPPFEHSSSFIELSYVLSGTYTEDICFSPDRKESITLTEGQVCIFPPNLKHAVHIDSDDCLLINILIRTSVMKQTISNLVVEDHALFDFFLYTLYENEQPNYLLFSTGSDLRLRNLILDMFIEFNSVKSYSQQALVQLLGLFFTYLQRDYSKTLHFSGNSTAGLSHVPQILNYIRQNFDSVTAENIAEHFSISPSWLRQIFRENTHTTVTDVIQQTRIERACDLLSTTNLPVQKVAEAVGYTDVTHFIRLFKKYQGDTPLQYRKKTY